MTIEEELEAAEERIAKLTEELMEKVATIETLELKIDDLKDIFSDIETTARDARNRK
ncbi:MAG: hypothetical protein WC683_04405 [bacterium]